MKHRAHTFDMQEIVEILSIFNAFKYVWLKQLKNDLQEKKHLRPKWKNYF